MPVIMRRSLSIAAVLCILFTGRAVADAFSDVQIPQYLLLTNGFTGSRTVVAQVEAGANLL